MSTLNLLHLLVDLSLCFLLVYLSFLFYKSSRKSQIEATLEKTEVEVLDELDQPIVHEIQKKIAGIIEEAKRITADGEHWGSDNGPNSKEDIFFKKIINEQADLILIKTKHLRHLIDHKTKLQDTKKNCSDRIATPSLQLWIQKAENLNFEVAKKRPLELATNWQFDKKSPSTAKTFLPVETSVKTAVYISENGPPTLQQHAKNDLLQNDHFQQKVIAIIEEHLTNPNLSVGFLSRAVGLSKSQLGRKLAAVSGKSPLILIRTIKLSKAKALLKTTRLTIAEIAYETGFSDPNYFTRLFVSEMKLSPTAFRSQHQANSNF